LIPFARKPQAEDPAVYRSLFDDAGDARFVLDAHATVLHANTAATRLFGATETALHGLPFSELVAPQSAGGLQNVLAATRTPPARAGPVALDARFADGTIFPIEIEVIHGTADRYGIVVRDRRARAKTPGPAARKFNPGQVLIASRIQELV
jgi:PAS domain S-box-containing protein